MHLTKPTEFSYPPQFPLAFRGILRFYNFHLEFSPAGSSALLQGVWLEHRGNAYFLPIWLYLFLIPLTKLLFLPFTSSRFCYMTVAFHVFMGARLDYRKKAKLVPLEDLFLSLLLRRSGDTVACRDTAQRRIARTVSTPRFVSALAVTVANSPETSASPICSPFCFWETVVGVPG